MQELHALAQAIGLQRIWWDVDGREHVISDASLRAIAAALGYPAETAAQTTASLARVEFEDAEPPAMLVTEVGSETHLPKALANAEITLPDGSAKRLDTASWTLPPIDTPGYYPVSVNGHAFTLAVAPRSCPTLASLGKERIWGPAVQIPALRGKRAHPFGNFAELAEAVDLFAGKGADALAINPVHALFAGYGRDFSPYSPSSRLYLNGAMGDPALVGLPPLPDDPQGDGPLIDWEEALPRRLEQLRATFAGLDEPTRARIARDNAAQGEGLIRQAIYDAIDVRLRAEGAAGWQQWPPELRDPDGEAVAAFARDNAAEVEFHLFTQWLARESLALVQHRARTAGMAVGLLADLAVGVHTGGADAWSMGDVLLQGLTIGAPPDPLGPLGQNWMLTGFSPRGLARSGYAPWIATIRAALSTAGALRIDHAFGLARLWVVPEGQPSSAGAYLHYPFADLVRLVTLEAHLAGALIVAEDLGTMPHGFGPAITGHGMLGMRVLWFERAADDGFIGAADYDPQAVAMTGTHDTATVAGWWSGRDLQWAQQLSRLPDGTTMEQAEARRAWDRGLLWASLTHDSAVRPRPEDTAPVVQAALRHIGSTPCDLAIVPLEDLLAEPEQPNLPGTIAEHPNWRRRLDAPLSQLLDDPATADRVSTLDEARKAGATP
ncbi:4-alpha-glucanotransferase [Novosphingobium guangzhouense]|uniref:4-alpha-glucanotransferase n=1 Tax=Novosphingobium guangzhouense TaxID=1850347 RepID=A0A2K2G2R0_9SPHN|nr:4-alpha-glucanotransferase [Novosphingobium guangzhouense]PNU05330.1 4-alpha-glucanotransferase [Novosphingobium guangzhouense]